MEILNNITLLTCTFNNNLLTKCMIMSLFKQLGKSIPVVIMDNGTKEFCTNDMKEIFTVIDNTNYKIIPNYKQVSRNHCASIDYALKNYIKTKYVLLCDNDILFKSSIKKLFNDLNILNEIDSVGEIELSKRGYRLFPFFCIINVEKMKLDKINYFNKNNCMNNMETKFDTNGNYESNIYLTKNIKGLDTGGSFLNEIKNKKWTILKIKLDKYIKHFAMASWNPKVKNNIYIWLKINESLFKYDRN